MGFFSAPFSPGGTSQRYPLRSESRSSRAGDIPAVMATVQNPVLPGFKPRCADVLRSSWLIGYAFHSSGIRVRSQGGNHPGARFVRGALARTPPITSRDHRANIYKTGTETH